MISNAEFCSIQFWSIYPDSDKELILEVIAKFLVLFLCLIFNPTLNSSLCKSTNHFLSFRQLVLMKTTMAPKIRCKLKSK